MKKYQKLEQQVKKLQAEIDRLKNQEKENTLPGNFNRNDAIEFLKEPSSDMLDSSFRWDSTFQGESYWDCIYYNLQENSEYKVPNEAIIQIQKWVILSFQEEYEK